MLPSVTVQCPLAYDVQTDGEGECLKTDIVLNFLLFSLGRHSDLKKIKWGPSITLFFFKG